MNNIDSTAHKYFYVGCLTLLLAFKFNHFEKSEIISGVDTSIEGVFKHIQLLKDISTILYFQFTLFRSLNHFLKKEIVEVSVLEELMESFKSLKIYRKFRKK
jgi:hypothetical protein